jgi:DNA-binding transcriptional regulator YdaS (Cro superfamily)
MLGSRPMSDPKEALDRALKAAGGQSKLAAALDISAQAISQWDEVPPLRVLAVEQVSGVPRHELRPDLYPPPAEAAA